MGVKRTYAFTGWRFCCCESCQNGEEQNKLRVGKYHDGRRPQARDDGKCEKVRNWSFKMVGLR